MSDQPWFKHWAKQSLASSDIQTLTDHQFRVWWSLVEIASIQADRWTIRMARKDLARMCASTPDKLGKVLKELSQREMIEMDGLDRITITNADKYQDTPDAARKRRERERAQAGQVTDKSRTRPRTSHGPVTANVTGEERGQRKEERVAASEASAPPPPATGSLRESLPPAIREVADELAMAIPSSRMDADTYEGLVQVAQEYPADTIREARAQLRRERKLPYPSNLYAILRPPKPVVQPAQEGPIMFSQLQAAAREKAAAE